jgi:hypothetical protein
MGDTESTSATDPKKIMVKTYLTEGEHKQLRHAAAERGLNLSDYVKEAVLLDVKKVMSEYLNREFGKTNAAEGE